MNKRIFFYFLISIISTQSIISQCNHPDYAGLMAFYNNTGGANWVNNTGWKEGAAGTNCNPCNGWWGISCENNRVVTIFLTRNNLIGTLHPDISKIQFLKLISLSNNGIAYPGNKPNKINGQIPQEISALQNLTYLDFYTNEFSGNIPTSIYTLKNLVTLDLGSNNLSGSISSNIQMLSKLQDLRLNGNDLTGKIPSEIGNLINLKRLELQSNKFEEADIPETFKNLKNLTHLYLNHCNLIGKIPEIFDQMTNLNHLSLFGNKLTEELPESLYKCSELITLHLGENLITGVISNKIRNLQKLEQFFAWNNKLCGYVPKGLFELKNLQYLDLGNNDFSIWSLPPDINKLKRLRLIQLISTNLTGNLPEELTELDSLSYVDLSNNKLIGCFPSSYKKFCEIIFYSYANKNLPWSGEIANFCLTDGTSNAQIGAFCDDDNIYTISDSITINCECNGLFDMDLDSFPDGIDCNDNLPWINPNAYDYPNNDIDENCNGVFENDYLCDSTVIVYDTIITEIFDTTIITLTEIISVTDTLIINLNVPNSSNQTVENIVLVYPNPTSSHITIDMGDYTLLENYDLQILNALGQPVYFTTIDKKLYYIDLNTWTGKGVYFVRIKNPSGITILTKKIILQ